MIISRVFNNNAVAVQTDDNQDAVLIGSGIGFGKKAGEQAEAGRAEKIYYIQSDMQTKFLKFLGNTDETYLNIADAILKHASEIGLKIAPQVIVALTEHISFAVQRFHDGVHLPNLMLSEIQAYYPQEYEVGVWGVDLINSTLHESLDKDEAGYIAMHVINGAENMDVKHTVETLEFVKGTINCIEQSYSIKIDMNRFETQRLITHLKFLSQRVFLSKTLDSDTTKDMYQFLIENHPEHSKFVDLYRGYVKERFGYSLSEQELVYILIHITKFLSE